MKRIAFSLFAMALLAAGCGKTQVKCATLTCAANQHCVEGTGSAAQPRRTQDLNAGIRRDVEQRRIQSATVDQEHVCRPDIFIAAIPPLNNLVTAQCVRSRDRRCQADLVKQTQGRHRQRLADDGSDRPLPLDQAGAKAHPAQSHGGDHAGWATADDGDICAQAIQRGLSFRLRNSGWLLVMRT